jgi:uncharacterized protein YjiS (DUF1127 family)
MKMLKAIISAYRKHAIYRTTYKELSSLPDKELRDIGIDRSDIENIARESAYGEVVEPTKKVGLLDTLFKAKTDKNRMEEYLSEAENLVDLENRIRAIDHGLAPWQIRNKNFAASWT